MRIQAFSLLVGIAFVSCGRNTEVAGPSPPKNWVSEPSRPTASVDPPSSSALAPSHSPVGSEASTRPALLFPDTHFPPKDFAPPFERSAQAEDGHFTPLGDAARGDRAASEPIVMVKTLVHPHKVSQFATVTIVAIDLQAAELRLAAGTQEPDSEAAKQLGPSGLIPANELDRALAVFNGGYKTNHGQWGVKVDGQVLVPPKQDGCTVAIRANGTVAIGTYSALKDPDGFLAFRQTPPCLLEGGALHEQLEKHYERPWGGRDPKRKTRRRSAVGIDESGRILFYGFGVEVGPELLARGLRAAGAHSAAQLDINWSWTRFLLLGDTTPEAPVAITSTLVPQMTHTKRGYVGNAAPRDFFYILRR